MFDYISNLNYQSITEAAIANIVAALIAATIFFIFKEKIFKTPTLTGKFHLKLNILSTEYNPFKDMEIQFILHLSSDNRRIIGGGEKVYENSPNAKIGAQVIHFQRNGKTPVSIEGSITKNIFSQDEINLLFHVHDRAGESTMIVALKYPCSICNPNPKKIHGEFTWSASNKTGKAILSKEKFFQKPHFIPKKDEFSQGEK